MATLAAQNRANIAFHADQKYREAILAPTLDASARILVLYLGAPNRAEAREAAKWLRAGHIRTAQQRHHWL
jgi:hypothetical protein